MSIPLTPERIASVYECLRVFPPFTRLKLPGAEWIEFRVSRIPNEHGHYQRRPPPQQHKHHISVSARNVGHFSTLAWVVGHEMLHLHQGIAKTETSNTQHNAEYRRLAASACKRFGWDLHTFVGT